MQTRTDTFYLNELITIMNNYVTNNLKKIKSNESGRRDDVLQIAQLIYSAAGFTVAISKIFTPERLANFTFDQQWFPELPTISNRIVDLQQLANNIRRVIKNIKTSFGMSDLRTQLTMGLDTVIKNKHKNDAEIKESNTAHNLDFDRYPENIFKLLKLPTDILDYTLLFLELKDIYALMLTCKKVSKIALDENNWRTRAHIYYHNNVNIIGVKKDKYGSYHGIFRNLPTGCLFNKKDADKNKKQTWIELQIPNQKFTC